MTSEAKILTGIGLATVIIIIAGLFFAGSQSKPAEVKIQQEILTRADNPRITGTDPKIQIVEFGDFQCPACAVLAPEIKKVLDTYGDKVDFIYRVIPIHAYSIQAASVSYAANEQGKFVPMYEKLFATQDIWSQDSADRATLFNSYAEEIGLNMTQFQKDLSEKAAQYASIVEADAKDASIMGVMATPTLIINGKTIIQGATSFENMKKIIDEALQEAPAESNQ